MIVDVYEAVTSRRAVRGFTDRPVPREVLERVLSAAAWAPSGSNIQPWHIYVVTGGPLAELKRLAGERVAAGDPWDEREYEMYPPALKSPYRERRSAFGEQRYGALGIAREDLEARQRAAIRELGLFRRARRPVLLHRPRPGPAPMGRRRHVSADRHAAAPRRRAAQLPADGVVGVSQDRRGGPVTPGRAHPLLRHVDRVRGRHGGLRPYGPGAARRDGHVRRGLTAIACARVVDITRGCLDAIRNDPGIPSYIEPGTPWLLPRPWPPISQPIRRIAGKSLYVCYQPVGQQTSSVSQR